MSFLSKVIGIGAAAAAAAVAVKIAKKYEENKELDSIQNEDADLQPDEVADAQPYYEEQADNAPVAEPEVRCV